MATEGKDLPVTPVGRLFEEQKENKKKPTTEELISSYVDSNNLTGLLELRNQIFEEIKNDHGFDLLDPGRLESINKEIFNEAKGYWSPEDAKEYLANFEKARMVCMAITKLIRANPKFAEEVSMDEAHQEIAEALSMTNLQLTAIALLTSFKGD